MFLGRARAARTIFKYTIDFNNIFLDPCSPFSLFKIAVRRLLENHPIYFLTTFIITGRAQRRIFSKYQSLPFENVYRHNIRASTKARKDEIQSPTARNVCVDKINRKAKCAMCTMSQRVHHEPTCAP